MKNKQCERHQNNVSIWQKWIQYQKPENNHEASAATVKIEKPQWKMESLRKNDEGSAVTVKMEKPQSKSHNGKWKAWESVQQ